MISDIHDPKAFDEGRMRTLERAAILIVTLSFAVVAAATQTFSKTPGVGNEFIEISGWILLLLAGLLGIYRIQNFSNLYLAEWGIRGCRGSRQELSKNLQATVDATLRTKISTELEHAKQAEASLTSTRNNLKKRNKHLMVLNWILFVGGLTLIVLSRALAILLVPPSTTFFW